MLVAGLCFNTQPPEGGCLQPSAAAIGRHVFQHTAARRRLRALILILTVAQMFQHTAARRRLRVTIFNFYRLISFQHTAARRRLHTPSTRLASSLRFNTQPPEGGCRHDCQKEFHDRQFQHTAARRRLLPSGGISDYLTFVSTHSRPKAAALDFELVEL